MEGEILNLVVDNRKQETETQAFRQICKGTSLNDIAEEVYTTEIYVELSNLDIFGLWVLQLPCNYE